MPKYLTLPILNPKHGCASDSPLSPPLNSFRGRNPVVTSRRCVIMTRARLSSSCCHDVSHGTMIEPMTYCCCMTSLPLDAFDWSITTRQLIFGFSSETKSTNHFRRFYDVTITKQNFLPIVFRNCLQAGVATSIIVRPSMSKPTSSRSQYLDRIRRKS